MKLIVCVIIIHELTDVGRREAGPAIGIIDVDKRCAPGRTVNVYLNFLELLELFEVEKRLNPVLLEREAKRCIVNVNVDDELSEVREGLDSQSAGFDPFIV